MAEAMPPFFAKIYSSFATIYEGEVYAAHISGEEGEFEVFAEHTPLFSSASHGALQIKAPQETVKHHFKAAIIQMVNDKLFIYVA